VVTGKKEGKGKGKIGRRVESEEQNKRKKK
jgi:hypothetical protein